ncbi:MAG: cobalamin B12-binding domain-containing protein [Firmicutes bacterium]|nr:cobalamin B12-binding domain-containing protein [Bacillota bacterium]
MNQYYPSFLAFLDHEDKDGAIGYVLNLLREKKITLENLYEDLITPALLDFTCLLEDHEICVWKEHFRQSIIRTLTGATYPFVMERVKSITKNGKKVLVFCPSGEYQEINALIVHNYFLLAGFDSRYIGTDTERDDVLSAVRVLKPDYLVLNVTNHFNVVVSKKIIDLVKAKYPSVKIVISGRGFEQPGATDHVTFDFHIHEGQDIAKLGGAK